MENKELKNGAREQVRLETVIFIFEKTKNKKKFKKKKRHVNKKTRAPSKKNVVFCLK